MVHRIFEASQVRCRCVVELAEGGLIRVDVTRISRSEAQLATPVRVAPDRLLEVVLELPTGQSLVLPARVVASGTDGLRIQWRFYDEAEASDLEATLAKATQMKVNDMPPEATVRPPSVEDAPSPRVMIDGKLDVEATLRSRALHVQAKKLAARYDNVRVLRLSMITELIQEAVNQAVESIDRSLTEQEKHRLLQETERGFAERLEAFKIEQADLQARAKALEKQLESAQALLEEERLAVISRERFLVSDAGLATLSTKLQRLFDHSIRGGGIDAATEKAMREVVERLLDSEREKIREQAEQAQSERIALLEAKVSRLSRTLDETREQRDRARRGALTDADARGVNIYQPGLSDGDPDRNDKLALLLELVEDNLELRKHVKPRGGATAAAESPAPARAPEGRRLASQRRKGPPGPQDSREESKT
ncbi:MAG: hypothetical protein AB7O52_11900 [Planctomycetota bacterium]